MGTLETPAPLLLTRGHVEIISVAVELTSTLLPGIMGPLSSGSAQANAASVGAKVTTS